MGNTKIVIKSRRINFMKKKNILAIILASLVLTVAVFSGCDNVSKPASSNNDNPSVSDGSSQGNNSDNQSSQDEPDVDNSSDEPSDDSSDSDVPGNEPPVDSSTDESSEPPAESDNESSDNESPYYSDDESAIISRHEKSNVTDNDSFNTVFKGNALDTAFSNEQAEASSYRDMTSITVKYANLWLSEVENAYEQIQASSIEDGTKQEIKNDYEAWKNGIADKKQEFKTEAAADGASAQLSAAAKEMNYYRSYAAGLYEKVFQQTNEFNLAYNG